MSGLPMILCFHATPPPTPPHLPHPTPRQEKQDKAVLQAEVQHLRQDNLRLQEESQTAAAQLRKFTEWFFNTIDKKP